MTVEEFAALPPTDTFTELVRGVVVESPLRGFRHGVVCANVGFALFDYVRPRKLGWACSNNVGVITRRNPDTVRGPDLVFISNERLPSISKVHGYAEQPPELVVEVRSPEDRLWQLTKKVAEYLDAGVEAVCVVNPQEKIVSIVSRGFAARVLTESDELTLPEVFADFRVPVQAFFE